MKRALAYVLATWFGCGFVPLAPGTAGTLAAVPLYLVLRSSGPAAVLFVATALGIIGIWAADHVIAKTGLKDPQIVVIDEVVGVLVTLAASRPTSSAHAARLVKGRNTPGKESDVAIKAMASVV